MWPQKQSADYLLAYVSISLKAEFYPPAAVHKKAIGQKGTEMKYLEQYDCASSIALYHDDPFPPHYLSLFRAGTC